LFVFFGDIHLVDGGLAITVVGGVVVTIFLVVVVLV
jgi:hypothetical protein